MTDYLLPSHQEFAQFRLQSDPLADEVIAKILSVGDQSNINAVFKTLRNNADVDQTELPAVIQAYFRQTEILPDWTDPELLKIGEDVFARFGPQVSMCLLCKSLPEAYACANGAKVLYTTGRMTEHQGSLKMFTRRLMETSQFVMNVCSKGGMEPGGNGIVTAQKVRLIHASIRYFILKHGWDTQQFGLPINQQDMAGTLQSFSTLVLEGLEKLDIQLSEEEKQGYYHSWRVVGHIMGLDDRLNPVSHKDGFKLGKAILADQVKGSEEGEELTKAVIDFMKGLMPGNLFDYTPEVLIRYLVGDEIAKELGVNHHNSLIELIAPRLLGHLFHEMSEIEDKVHFIKTLAENFNGKLLQGMLNHFNEDKQVRFYIPPDLKHNWKLA
ncbi:DUF2236 domain-containing protein [Paracrocinitomix mangrovi]|uniref:oxygenase MpaB family protein n=1 Tax=Paracrocinitomix mangrovi TaxID=2862509 RepID=UPI001C8D000D|nr:oxygenase MpaB family protein [Paracrocinitomix mangrovi]UKN02041.1 DUF2236 domain-containing protein [Paracrocinitomix mangrovi]